MSEAQARPPTGASKRPFWRAATLVPLVLFGLLVALFAAGLGLNPREVPSPLIGKPVPEFELARSKGAPSGLQAVTCEAKSRW